LASPAAAAAAAAANHLDAVIGHLPPPPKTVIAARVRFGAVGRCLRRQISGEVSRGRILDVRGENVLQLLDASTQLATRMNSAGG